MQAQALTALAATDQLADDDPAVMEFADPRQTIRLRSAALSVAREHPDLCPAALTVLADDPFAPFRASACMIRNESGPTGPDASDAPEAA